MLIQFFKSYVRTAARPITMIGVVAALLLSSVSSVFAVASTNGAAVAAVAFPVLPASTQFDITGFLQSASLDASCAADPHCGGTLTINGITITIPKETIVILPASALTWQELFALAPAPYGPTQTGMALNDAPKPLTTYEFQVVGNRVGDQYIAGLVHVSQQDLNTGAGYINFINYATGEMRVGGTLGSSTTGARVRINDPSVSASSTATAGFTYADPAAPTFAALPQDPTAEPTAPAITNITPNSGVTAGGTLVTITGRYFDTTGGTSFTFGGVPAIGVNCTSAINCTATTPAGIAGPVDVIVTRVTGRYGRAMTPDVRFQVDQDNPTIASATGFPMCFPRTDPTGLNPDALCPETNRPVDPATNAYAMSIDMNDPAAIPLGGALDPRLQAPLEIGDYINYAGTLIADAAGTYISAHTINNNTAIYTAPGTSPAYITVEVGLIGTGGLTVVGAGEAAIRTRFEGMTTDSTRPIHLYGVDLNPDGSTSDRDWGTIGVDPGPAGGLGAVRGRWRFRPPCAPFGTDPASIKFDKQCIYGPQNGFLPPTREVRAVIEGLQTQVTALNAADKTKTTANGIFYGQYHAPIGEYIFPENVPGSPIVENNFNTLDFLAIGGYSSITGVIGCQLNPWPSNILPPASTCGQVVPVANAGANQIVASGANVTLTGGATGNPTPTFSWVQNPADTNQVALTGAATSSATFTAPIVAATTTLHFSLTATNSAGSDTASTTVTVNATGAPTVNQPVDQTVDTSTAGSFTVSGVDPALLPLTFNVAQSGSISLSGLTVTSNGPDSAAINYTAPATPGTVTLTITATNSVGLTSAPVTNTVTVVDPNPNVAPVANAGGPYTAASGSNVTLSGSATGNPSPTFVWAQDLADANQVVLSGANTAIATFTAPNVAVTTTLHFNLTATNTAGTNTTATTVTVNAVASPSVTSVSATIPADPIITGANAAFDITGSDPASQPLTFTVTQTGAPALLNLVVTSTGTTSAHVTFTAPASPSVVTLTIKANNGFVNSSAVAKTVNVVSPADTVAISAAEYRTSKQRLILTASSNNPAAVLTLLSYNCEKDVAPCKPNPAGGPWIFDPSTLGNQFILSGGIWTLTLVGAPAPACNRGGTYATPCNSPFAVTLVAKSNSGGVSPAVKLDKIRQ